MTAQIALHIGAHKTATTHLQRSLSEQSETLTARGVRFFGPPAFRKGASIDERFGLVGDVSVEQAQQSFAQMVGNAERVIISEENFVGTMHNRFAQMAFPIYPNAASQISALADRIAPEGLDVFLGVRDPAEYISSCYGQALIGGHRVVLEDVKTHNQISAIDWADLVARVRAADGVRSLTVWCYEDYHAVFAQILDRLVGPESGITPLKTRVHPGLSQKAVARILMGYANGKTRQAAVRAREKFPVGPDHPPFDAFDPWERNAAATQYATQIAKIEAMDDVTLLKA